MSVISFPSDITPNSQTWEQRRNDMEFRSMFGAQAVEISAPLWSSVLTWPKNLESNRGALQAVLMQLRGKTNQLSMWNFGRPQPRGTMRGTMTLNAGAAQGDTTMSVTAGAGESGKTLLKGDYLGIGSGTTQQVVMVVADATANGSGVISVTFEPALRNAHSGGASVTWDKPCALFRCVEAPAKWSYQPGNIADGFTLHLLEDVRA